MPESMCDRNDILKPCPKCGKMRGRIFDLPRIDDGDGGDILLMPDGGMIPESRLCSCPKGERPYRRLYGYGKPLRLPESTMYDYDPAFSNITLACRCCWWKEGIECFCEDLAIITIDDEGRRRGESIPGNDLLIDRCRKGRFWVDRFSTMMNGLPRIFDAFIEAES